MYRLISDVTSGSVISVALTPEEVAFLSSQPAPATPIPQIVTRAQFKLALLDLDLLDDVDALVAASTDRALQINWAERLEFERNHPLVIATAAALGKTEAEIDALFVLAASK